MDPEVFLFSFFLLSLLEKVKVYYLYASLLQKLYLFNNYKFKKGFYLVCLFINLVVYIFLFRVIDFSI